MLWTISCKPYPTCYDELLPIMCKTFPTLRSFTDSTYSWKHECTLDFATLDILTTLHGRSLKKFEIYEYGCSGPLTGLVSCAISSFHCSSLNFFHNLHTDFWAYDVLAKSRKSLKELTLGFEQAALVANSDGSMWDYTAQHGQQAKRSKEFVKYMILRSEEISNDKAATLHLESLRLCGFDSFAIAGHQPRSFIDFESLATLSLESCAGLEETFTAWSGATHSFPQACIAPNLLSLTVRSETPGPGLQSQLELFICSLRGLVKLYILLEGDDDYALSLSNILDAHGRTLRYFLWDLRKDSDPSTRAMLPDYISYTSKFELVLESCPDLRELGLALNWYAIQRYPSPRHRVCDLDEPACSMAQESYHTKTNYEVAYQCNTSRK